MFFRKLTSKEIEDYVATGEPLERGGGYAIQELGSKLVDHIEGDYDNVVGLPLTSIKTSLKELGVL